MEKEAVEYFVYGVANGYKPTTEDAISVLIRNEGVPEGYAPCLDYIQTRLVIDLFNNGQRNLSLAERTNKPLTAYRGSAQWEMWRGRPVELHRHNRYDVFANPTHHDYANHGWYVVDLLTGVIRKFREVHNLEIMDYYVEDTVTEEVVPLEEFETLYANHSWVCRNCADYETPDFAVMEYVTFDSARKTIPVSVGGTLGGIGTSTYICPRCSKSTEVLLGNIG
jgi:hypothetical protein